MRLTINHIEEDFIFVISVVKLTFTSGVARGGGQHRGQLPPPPPPFLYRSKINKICLTKINNNSLLTLFTRKNPLILHNLLFFSRKKKRNINREISNGWSPFFNRRD